MTESRCRSCGKRLGEWHDTPCYYNGLSLPYVIESQSVTHPEAQGNKDLGEPGFALEVTMDAHKLLILANRLDGLYEWLGKGHTGLCGGEDIPQKVRDIAINLLLQARSATPPTTDEELAGCGGLK